MKVLILNRRCVKNSQKGGAEIYTYQIAKGMVEIGWTVEWFSSMESGLLPEEFIDGIKFIRKGNEFTTHFYGLLYTLKKDKDWLIIDEFNGIGYFGFLFKKSILLIHQIYGEFWIQEFGILGNLFKFLEKLLLWFYRNRLTITVSKSTLEDLKKLGFMNIKIVPNGLEIEPLKNLPKKNKNFTMIYLGRLKKTKNPEDAILTFLEVKKQIQDAKLNIVGTGPLENYLRDKYSSVEGVNFYGYVDELKKYELLKESHLLLIPSIREGWGQVVIQANAVGTIAVGYNVPGLRDSILDGKTGYLVNNVKEMIDKVIFLSKNIDIYEKMQYEALKWAKNFSWEKTKQEFIKILRELK